MLVGAFNQETALVGVCDCENRLFNTHTQVLNLRHGLRLLDMSANKIAQIPERVAGLRCQQADNWCLVTLDQPNVLNISRNLKSLFLNQNRLTSLPNELGDIITFLRHLVTPRKLHVHFRVSCQT